MAPPRSYFSASGSITWIAILLTVATLRLAREVLIPIALSVLLCFLLAPLVDRVQRVGLRRVPAVIVVALMSFSLIGFVGWLAMGQVEGVFENLPQYRERIGTKVKALSNNSVFAKATKSIEEIAREVTESGFTPETADPSGASSLKKGDLQKPVPVVISERPLNPLRALAVALRPLQGILVNAGIVIVFVIFMLIQREDLRDRSIRLIGSRRLMVTTNLINDAAQRVSRYLMLLLIVNVTYGAAVATGMQLIGLDNVILWGVLACMLRFIPYAGPWIGASLPILLSLAEFDGWTHPLMLLGFFLVLELLINNLMEPLLYGRQTGLSTVALLVAAVFWGWLWGPVGLVLSMPMTLCLVVVGQHIPRMEILSVLLSDQPSLPLRSRIYQRLLASDQDEVYEVAEEYLRNKKLLQLYDDGLVPALGMAERDRHNGELAEGQEKFIYQSLRDLVENLGERERKLSATVHAGDRDRIVCLPASDHADELAATMLAQVLEAEGFAAEVISVSALASESMELVESKNPSAVLISAMPPLAVMHSRYLCKRLSARFQGLKVIVGLWNAQDESHAKERIQSCGPETVLTTFAEVVERLSGKPSVVVVPKEKNGRQRATA